MCDVGRHIHIYAHNLLLYHVISLNHAHATWLSPRLQTSINVTYHNPDRRDLFGEPPKRYEVGLRDGSKIQIDGGTITSDLALKIRKVVFVDSIDAYF